jgi:anaerobic selenocysteine-containing dehydrogenase
MGIPLSEELIAAAAGTGDRSAPPPTSATPRPTSEALLTKLAGRARIPLDEVRRHPHGAFFESDDARVLPGDPEKASGRLDLLPADVAAELEAAIANPVDSEGRSHVLVSRRMREVINTLGRHVDGLPLQRYNPAYLHPDDLAAQGLTAGDHVRISSAHGSIDAVVAADETVRGGVVSMSHCWGRLPDEQHELVDGGSNPGLLISTTDHVESINHMPRMSAIPVDIEPVTSSP